MKAEVISSLRKKIPLKIITSQVSDDLLSFGRIIWTFFQGVTLPRSRSQDTKKNFNNERIFKSFTAHSVYLKDS